MSANKFEQPQHKVFESSYHTQRPIIVDEGIESPDTITLRYEEEAARANGGDARCRSSTDDAVTMAAYKTQPVQLHGFADGYTPYSQQSFQPSQDDNSLPQLNSLAFGANNTTGQYMEASTAAPAPAPVNVLSCSPTTGTAGTRVEVKVSSHYDLTAMATTEPYVYLSYGANKCHADVLKETVSSDGLTYIVSAEAPPFVTTNCQSPSSVPLSLVIATNSGDEMARVPVPSSFSYHDVAAVPTSAMEGAPADSGAAAAPENITRKSSPQSAGQHGSPPQMTVRTSTTNSPVSVQNPLALDSSTNTFSYPSTAATAAVDAAAQQVQQVQNNYAAAAAVAASTYSQDNGSMLGGYRSASFSDGFSRAAPPQLRAPATTPAWNPYGSVGHHGHQQPHQHQHHTHHGSHDHRYGVMNRSNSVANINHSSTSIARSSLSIPLPAPGSSGTPQLIRTSTIQSATPGSSGGMGTAGYGSGNWAGYPTKAVLTIIGNLDSMAQDWSPEEWNNRRRIVLFRKKQSGCHLEATFRPIPVNERPPNSICISCIYWAEKQECFVTSVDTINLLEQLVAAPSRFSVEEKNRIRRNLEGFKPVTVSKAKAESEEFFKLIMAFGAPKPRTIEKDVKVFPWKILGQALKKIISKYSANPSSMAPSGPSTTQSHHMLTPVTMSPSYHGLPPTPGSMSATTDSVSAGGYVSVSTGPNPSDSLASPRSLSGASWGPYHGASGASVTGRGVSPGTVSSKPQSLSTLNMRMGGLPTAYDTRSSGVGHAYAHHQHQLPSFNSPLPVTTANAGPSSSTTSTVTSGSTATAASGGGHGPHGHTTNRWEGYDVTAGSGAHYANSHHQHSHHNQMYSVGYGDSAQRA